MRAKKAPEKGTDLMAIKHMLASPRGAPRSEEITVMIESMCSQE